jgi:hypothetical protein
MRMRGLLTSNVSYLDILPDTRLIYPSARIRKASTSSETWKIVLGGMHTCHQLHTSLIRDRLQGVIRTFTFPSSKSS